MFDSGEYQITVVARDATGLCIHWRVKKLRGTPSPVVAEACAARLAILLAQEMGWSHVHLESNCLQVIYALNDRDEECLQFFSVVISAGLSFMYLMG